MFEVLKKKTFGIGKIAYPFRLLGYYFGILILLIDNDGLSGLSNVNLGILSIALIYPHLGLIAYKIRDNSRRVEKYNLNFDSIMLGVFIVQMHFALVPSCVFIAMILSGQIAILGFSRVMYIVLFLVIGSISMGFLEGFHFDFLQASSIDLISVVALSLFSILFSYLGFLKAKSLKSAKADIRRQRNSIEQKKVLLEKLNKEKDQLVGIAAHDLKSPLNQIIALVQITELSGDSLNSGQKENLSFIKKSALRMRDMIGKILDINAIESGDLDFDFQLFDIKEKVSEVIEIYRNDALFKNISINFDFQDEACYVRLDKNFFIQIVENLISNAIKFTKPHKNIFISIGRRNEEVVLKIRDEGPGISKTEQKMLFNKFQKLSAKPTGNEQSSGLGLSIVKKYTEAMKGKVWCESELGKGATFFVEFNCADQPVKVQQNES